MIDNAPDLSKELDENKMFKKEVRDLVGEVSPHIPRVGLLCGGLIISKHVVNRRKETCSDEQSESGGARPMKSPPKDLFSDDDD